MSQNIFKIYDGRTNFWQWDTKQKLIVLDERVTEVHFSNRNMTHSIQRDVYIDKDGLRVCNVPGDLLQLPRNLVAYACADGTTLKAVKFAVIQRPMPRDYIAEQNEDIEERLTQIDIKLENLDENKADDIRYDEEGKYIQLMSNGEPIGTRIKIVTEEAPGIVDCKINEDGDLIVTLANGHVVNAGHVGTANGATFTPHISADKILTWTCDKDLPVPPPTDLNPYDEWVELGDDGEVDSQYIWETL